MPTNSSDQQSGAATSPRAGRFPYWSCGVARSVLVLAFLTYGTAKLAGAQFVTSGGILDKPVADLSGIQLTWVYFGYSPLYSNFVAIGQFVAALLLVFGRTARFGAAVLLPITSNIVVVNFGYSIGLDTQIASLILLALNIYLLVWDIPLWKKFFWDESLPVPGRPAFMKGKRVVVLQATAFFIAAGGLFWLMSIQNSVGQSPVSGDWGVESATLDGNRITDPALGADWRWISFDQFGRLSVRTNQFTFAGRYSADVAGSQITLRYAAEPRPPIYPGQVMSDHLSPEQIQKIVDQSNDVDYHWPVEMTGTWHKNNDQLIITLPREQGGIEWVLSRYHRPKF